MSTANINHNDKFGLNMGGGLDRKLTKRLTFRIDLRDHVTGSPAFGLPGQFAIVLRFFPSPGAPIIIEYTAGFVFHIGKP